MNYIVKSAYIYIDISTYTKGRCYMKQYLKELIYYIMAGFMMWYCIILISDAENVKNYITPAIDRCMNVIIPSLFAFMAVSGIIVSSGAYIKLSKPFGLFSKFALAMPTELFSIFLISNVAGYPVGAKLIIGLYDKGSIDKKTAQIMQCFCFGAGPAFISSAVGLALFGSVRIGTIVFISCALSNLMIAAVMCRIYKLGVKAQDNRVTFSSQILTDSVLSAARSLFGICALIIFFSTVTSVVDHYGAVELIASHLKIPAAEQIIRSLLEISNITGISNAPYAYIPIIAAICSLGGICVILQLFAMVGGRYGLKSFLLTRLIAAALSFINCFWLCRLMLPESLTAFASDQQVFVKVNNFVPSVCLILMIFLLKIKKRVAFSK